MFNASHMFVPAENPAPAWLQRRVVDALRACGDHVRSVEVRRGSVALSHVHTLEVTFVVTDMSGRHVESTGLVRVPDALRHGGSAPLVVAAGDPLESSDALALAAAGRVVVSHDAESVLQCGRPLSRGINVDAALLHLARRLPCVDDRRVVLQGSGGGGHMALLLAAETFPLAAVVADAAPINWPLTAAYLSHAAELLPDAPALSSSARVVRRAAHVIGSADVQTAPWLELSAHTHLDLVTAPVSAVFSTADMLVPVEQVSARFARPAREGAFPRGYTADPAKLLSLPENRETLLDLLDPRDVEVRELRVPVGAPTLTPGTVPQPVPRIELPLPARRWVVCVLDEGARESHLHHLKHAVHIDRAAVLAHLLDAPDVAAQLTTYKLMTMMRRYAGMPWLVHGYPHLDTAGAERADVLRGLRTLVAAGGAPRLVATYSRLPEALRVLGAGVAAADAHTIAAALEALC